MIRLFLAVGLAALGLVGYVGIGSAEDAPARVRAMYEAYREESFPRAPDLSTGQYLALADSLEFVVLDVRHPSERAVSMIEGSIDEETWRAGREVGDRRPVLLYCTIGYRSGLATRELREEGVEAYNLRGGVLGWVHAGEPVVDPKTGESTRRVHVYGRRWNLLPEGWKAVW